MAKVYVASPLGFSEAGREFLGSKFLPSLRVTGHEILNPWEISSDLGDKLSSAMTERDIVKLRTQLISINREIALRNEKAIRKSDILVAVLDGQDVDSGVAAEVGFAYALGKTILGYRGDFRLTGDNLGAHVNLQIDVWIERSGGRVLTSLSQLSEELGEMRSPRLDKQKAESSIRS